MSTLNCFSLLEDAVRALPLVALRSDGFEAFLASHPVAGTEILKAILRLVGRRARKGNERLADEIEEHNESE